MLNAQQLSGHSIVMHSFSSFGRTVEAIRARGCQTINTFWDNDRVGKEHTEKFIAEFGIKAIPQSELFANYKDLNDALKANEVPDFLKNTGDSPTLVLAKCQGFFCHEKQPWPE